MKASQADIFIIPGFDNSGPSHWQSRWEEKIKTARRIEQQDWQNPTEESWISTIIKEVETATRPAILVAHSLGVIATVKALHAIHPGTVKGAFLVGLPDVEREELEPAIMRSFAPIPATPLPCPAILVASHSDPYCTYQRAETFGKAWGAQIVDAGEAGHINHESGHGPWPEGILTFARFLSGLK